MGKILILTSSFQVGFQPATGLPVGEYFVTCSNIIQNECQETREAVILGLSAVADQTCSGTCCTRVEDRAMNEDLNFLSRTGIFHCHVWFKFTAGYNLDQIIPSTYAPLVPHCSILVFRGTPYTSKKLRRIPNVVFLLKTFSPNLHVWHNKLNFHSMFARGPGMLVRRDDFVGSCAAHAHQAGGTKMKETSHETTRRKRDSYIRHGKLLKPNCRCPKATQLTAIQE